MVNVRLPHNDEKPGPAPQKKRDVTGKKVLLVEDDEDVRGLTVRLLQRMGFEVHQATSGEHVLSILMEDSTLHLDLLVTDVMLPGMDGPETARLVRQRQPKTPVVFMSGNPRGLDLDLNDEEDPTAYVSKPFGVEELASKIYSVLN